MAAEPTPFVEMVALVPVIIPAVPEVPPAPPPPPMAAPTETDSAEPLTEALNPPLPPDPPMDWASIAVDNKPEVDIE